MHLPALLPRLHGGKVDLSGYLCGEPSLSYELLHGWVHLGNELQDGGVASLAARSSMVSGLLHTKGQLDLHSTVAD